MVTRRLAIDPGDVHVGWAYDDDGLATPPETGEWTPANCIDELVFMLTRNMIDEIVVEEWVLYEWEAMKQAWSNLQTSQLIGGIKVVARMFRVPVVEQSATIKKPTRRQMKARGFVHQGEAIHARDAELHLYYRVLRRKKEEENACQSAQSSEGSSEVKARASS